MLVYFLELLALEIALVQHLYILAECLRNDQHEREPEPHGGKGTVFIFFSFFAYLNSNKVICLSVNALSKREIHVITML